MYTTHLTVHAMVPNSLLFMFSLFRDAPTRSKLGGGRQVASKDDMQQKVEALITMKTKVEDLVDKNIKVM